MRQDQATFFRLNLYPMPVALETKGKVQQAAVSFMEQLQALNIEAATAIIEFSPCTQDPEYESVREQLEFAGVYKVLGVVPQPFQIEVDNLQSEVV